MNARGDPETLHVLNALRIGIPTLNTEQALSLYHGLAHLRAELKTPRQRAALVRLDPKISAQIFYCLGDDQIGEMIVRNYSRSFNGELRELAEAIREVLNSRNSLTNVLEMTQLPKLHDEVDDWKLDPYAAATPGYA